jgi:copper chaperone CopZ
MKMHRVLLRASVPILALLCGACSGDVAPPPSSPITFQLDVRGMHCGGCVAAITAEAREVDGVESVEVSLERRAALLRVRDESTAVEVIRAIESLGYTVSRKPDQGDGAASPPAPPSVGG